jgi:hypothetical protein
VWHNLPTQDTPIDATFLEGVEVALDKLLGKDTPAVDEVGVWTPGSGGLIYQKIGTNQIAAGAVLDAQVGAAAAIAYTKLALAGKIKLNSDVDTSTALAIARLAGFPNDVTKALLGDGTWGSAGPKITYATTPPGSPADGDHWYYTGISGIYWHFVYDSSEATYKWKFVGGPPAMHIVTPGEATSSSSYVDLTTVGPTITLARAGEYNAYFGCGYFGSASTLSGAFGLKIGAAAVDTNSDEAGFIVPSAVNPQMPGMHQALFVAAASDVIKMQYKSPSTNSDTFSRRKLTIIPRRVI